MAKNLGDLIVKLSLNSANFDDGLTRLEAQVKQLQTQFASSKTGVVDFDKVVTTLRGSADTLTTRLAAQKIQVAQLEKAYEESKRTKGEDAAETQNLAIKLENAKARMAQTEQALANLNNIIALNENGWYKLGVNLESIGEKWQQVGTKLADTGKKLTNSVTKPLVNLGKQALTASIEFESAFAGVRKTVDATEDDFATLSNGIKEMAERIPVTTTALSKIMEMAGQLGVKGTDNLLSFTEVMAKLEACTDMTADTGAVMMAQFANITRMDYSNMEKLGSVIVALGNNFAAFEGDIVSMGQRLAASGELLGMTEAQVMAFATSLLSVGVNVEAGGTAFSKLMTNMKMAADTGVKGKEVIDATGMSLRELQLMADQDSIAFKELAGSMGLTSTELKNYMKGVADLDAYAEVCGMTAEQFAKAFAEDAGGAIMLFLDGLNRVEAEGGSAIVTLKEMGVNEVRLTRSILSATTAVDQFAAAQDMANVAWEENIALNKEFAERASTTESQITMLKSSANNLAIAFGDAMVPILLKVVDTLRGVIDWFKGLSDGQKQTILVIGATVAAFGPLLTVVGNVTKVVGGFMKLLAPLAKALGVKTVAATASTAATTAMAAAETGAAAATGTLSTAIGANTTATTGAATAQGAATITTTAFGTAQTAAATATGVLSTAITFLKSHFILITAAVAAVVAIVALFNKRTKEAQESIKGFAANAPGLSDAMNGVKPALMDVNNLLSATGKTMSQLSEEIGVSEQAITDILATALSEQRALRQSELDDIRQHMDNLLALQEEKLQLYRDQQLAELRKLQLEEATLTQEGATQRLVNMQEALNQANAVTEESYTQRLVMIENKYKAMNAVGSEAYNEELQQARAWYQTSLTENRSYNAQGLAVIADSAVQWVAEDLSKWEQLNSNQKIKGREFAAILETIDGENTKMFLQMVATAKAEGANISDTTKNTAKMMLDAFANLPRDMQDAGKQTLLGMLSGLESQIPSLKNMSDMSVDAIIDTLRTSLDIHSPSGVTQKIGQQAAEGLKQGLKGEMGNVSSQADSIGANLATGIWDGIQGKQSWLGSKLSGFVDNIVGSVKSFFGIKSPSTRMRDMIGQHLPSGIAEGVLRNGNVVAEALENIVPDKLDIAFGGFTGLDTAQTAFASVNTSWPALYERMRRGMEDMQSGAGNARSAQETGLVRALIQALRETRNTEDKPSVTVPVTQHIYAADTSYVQQQREAARQFLQAARAVLT